MLTDVLNRYLLDAYARGRHTVLIIDEAQNLSTDVLEQVRLLTNLETSTQKLLQIILIGQPELRTLLAREDMRQLAQRVTARYHLEPISRDETSAYIRHRLQICGSSQAIFNKRAVDKIQQLSGGIPRLINVLSDRSMLGAFVEGKTQVDVKVVKKAASEVLAAGSNEKIRRNRLPLLLGVLSLLLLITVAVVYQPWKRPESTTLPVAGTGKEPASVSAAEKADAVAAAAAAVDLQRPAEVVVAAVEDEPQQQSLATLLTAADSSYLRSAWTELLALWSVVLPESVNADFCEFAGQYGLLCLEEQGNWTTLRQFDRPAILTLVAADGERVAVVLQHLDDSVAEVLIGNELYRLPTEQVERSWYGDFTLLLQAPPGGRLFLRVGDRDPVVSWLRSQLEIAQGVIIPAQDPLIFDYALQREVLAFQRQHGLVADGVVGKNTMIHLNTASRRQGVPLLSAQSY